MMMLRLAAAFLLPFLIGFSIVGLVWRDKSPGGADASLKLALAVGLGLGVSSLGYFLWLVAIGPSAAGLFIAEALILVGLAILALRRRRRFGSGARPVDVASRSPAMLRLLAPAFALLVVAALTSFATLSAVSPHGRWDAWTIWNLRARFLYRSGENWQDAFSDLLAWTHLDYPLLVPGSIARTWTLAGADTSLASIILAALFMLGTVALLVAALSSVRGTSQGLAAGIVLLATATFVSHAASQYADVPLGFYMLATVVAIVLADRAGDARFRYLMLAGLMAGLAAWTKNEGLLFIGILFFARILLAARRRNRDVLLKDAGALLAGLAPVLAVILIFKLTLAPPNDILAAIEISGTVERLTDLSRYVYVMSRFGGAFLSFGSWIVNVPILLAVYLILLGVRIRDEDRSAVAWTLSTVGLMLLTYFSVYVATPHDLKWHLDTSLNRLLMQLWPSAVFVYFMIVRPPEEAEAVELTPAA